MLTFITAMADNTVPPLGPESPRADSAYSAGSSPPHAKAFTAYNLDEHGEPRRLRHVTRRTMQQHLDEGTIGEDAGPEHGFQGRPHGTDFEEESDYGRRPPLPNRAYVSANVPLDEADEEDDVVVDEQVFDEGENHEAESEAPAVAAEEQEGLARSYHGGLKRKRATSRGPAASLLDSDGHDLGEEPRRGRKKGGPRKENAPPWTDLECISLLDVSDLFCGLIDLRAPTQSVVSRDQKLTMWQLYINHPGVTHKNVAEMHNANFWSGDTTWGGRTFSACQQRMIALNNKSRERARLPGVLAQMKSTSGVTGGAEEEDGEVAEEDVDVAGEIEGEDGEGDYDSDDEDAGGDFHGGELTTAYRRFTSTQPDDEDDLAFDAEAANAARLLLSLSSHPF